jgi:3-oxoacyl-[acyl-carrier protein] reductase
MVKGKIIVITGASRGIGKTLAIELSKHGANVVLASRDQSRMKSFKDQLRGNWMIQKTNVRDEQSVCNLIAAVMAKYGRIDVLINNAGFVEPVGLLETSLELWQQTIETNLTGCFLCTKETVKFMKKTGGKIINIGSTAGLTARPGWSAYAASKAGVVNFSLTMAEELRANNIRVFCICPGRTATDLRKKLAPNEDPTTIMQPKAIVETIEYCISDAANVLEGQPILVRERK